MKLAVTHVVGTGDYNGPDEFSKEELNMARDHGVFIKKQYSQTSKEIYELLPIAFNQKQVVEASAVVAVLGDLENIRMAEKIYGQAVDAGFMPADTAKSMVEHYTGMYSSMPPEAIRQIAYTDGGLVSMQLMLVTRAKGYDTVPIGGYDKQKFMEAFRISERYIPIMLVAIGKAAKPGHPTVRLAVDDVAFFNEMPKE